MTSLKDLLISLRNRPVSIEVSGGVIHVKTSGADRILEVGEDTFTVRHTHDQDSETRYSLDRMIVIQDV